MSASVAKIVGTPTTRAWAQIHTFVPEEPELRKTHGELVAALSLELDDEASTQVVDVGREVLQRLQEEYYGKPITTPLEHLKQSVETVASTFSEGTVSLEIVCAIIYPNHVYFCIWGGGRVVVWREGKLATILSARQDMSGTSSGVWRAGDIFILGTEIFFEIVNKDVIASSLSRGLGPHDSTDDLAAIAHRSPRPTLAAALFKINPDEIVEADGPVVVNAPLDAQTPVSDFSLQPPPNTRSYPDESTTIKLNQKTFWQNWLIKIAEKLPDREVTIKSSSASSRKTAISVGIVLLVLLGASIIFGAQQKKAHDYKASYKDRLTDAQTAYNDAVMQKDINLPHSRELFQKARDTLDILAAQGIKDPEIDSLRQKLDQDSGSILGKVTTPAQLFIDLSLVRSGVVAREITINRSQLAILDGGGQRIITIGMADKDTDAVGGADKLAGAKSFAAGDEYYVLTSSGIVKQTTKGVAQTVVKQDGEWGEIMKVGFFGSNLYLLDKSNGIWRYSAAIDSFGDKKAWLKGDPSPNISDALDMAIDGSVWVLTSGGKVLKFNRGVEDNFVVSGADAITPTAFYTDENLENIYILDSSNKKVFEISKTGEYKKQYQTDMIGQAVDIAVSKSTGKIYLLTSDKIFTLDLQ